MPGYHFLGFGHSFIKYPSTILAMDFSNDAKADKPAIVSRTIDGLQINFKASFQYILVPNKLYDLYMMYGTDYKTPCQKYVIDILNDVATQYDAFRFFSNPDQISLDMFKYLNSTMAEHCYSNLQFFQLSGTDLPNDFEQSITVTSAKIQEIKTAETDLSNVQIELNTTITKAQISQDVIINNAKAKAEADLSRN